jgi:hypothetical protein
MSEIYALDSETKIIAENEDPKITRISWEKSVNLMNIKIL